MNRVGLQLFAAGIGENISTSDFVAIVHQGFPTVGLASGRIRDEKVRSHCRCEKKIQRLTKRRINEILRTLETSDVEVTYETSIDAIVLAPEAMLVEPTAPCEPCARCGLFYRLVRVGRLWMQPQHEFRVSEEEAVN